MSTTYATNEIKVGVFYYPWYNGTEGEGHWNSTEQWRVVDTPLLGFYNCSDEETLRRHLNWSVGLGLDYWIISWWGANSFEDNVTDRIFSLVVDDYQSIELTIMVEGFNESGTYDFDEIFDYIYYMYAVPYAENYLSINNKPLLCWWNERNLTGTLDVPLPANILAIHSDARFDSRIIGHNNYSDWYAGDRAALMWNTIQLIPSL